MGCCSSTNKPPPPPKLHHFSSKSSRAPPPPADEETVKEVLSETQNPQTFLKIEHEPQKITPRKSQTKVKHQDNNNNLEDNNNNNHNLFEISTPKFDEDLEVFRPKITEKSPPKKADPRLVSSIGNSPVRCKEQSPGRVRSVPGRDSRGVGFGSTSRRFSGAGNGSAELLRSPSSRAAAGSGGGGGGGGIVRSLSARKTRRSPGRVRSDLHERVRKSEMRSGVNNDESLENPLVSLECFIFL